ncbi:MAG TPA: response regulator transcription factor [Candidatus Kapabacteria bacterium]|nr:response regulator transcription factor [Candidatus Kapabacteria bacterium]HOV92573.1 response regulator transcription factor [Candidatus Kapabacteria bacterium]
MRILVVEDDEKLGRFIVHGLEQDLFIVEWTTNGSQAVDFIMNNLFDAIVLDVILPGKDGYSILREIREMGESTPVLLLSGRDTVEERVRGLDLGADDFMGKPFSIQELSARLRALLRRTLPDKTTKIKCGDLVLDTVSHIAVRDGKEIELTSKEYALLEYMMRNKNRILSRSTITQHVWKHNFDPDSNIIDVYVKRLRSKIDYKKNKQLVQSVRGVGYRIKDFEDD